ncbi:MAG: hypothetical protein JWM36_1074 [Hyphomicrobiales bacterium]|nr:hypothetical protein [Hyphomicrobiales bacterium]
MMTDTRPKPTPRPAPESLPYWQAAREHRLSIPRCDDCERFWFPPSRSCPHCLSPNFAFRDVSGRGKVFSFVTFHRVYHPAFETEVPYVVALVELEEGPRLLTNILGISHEEVRCEMPVEVVFDDVDVQTTVPKFRPSA